MDLRPYLRTRVDRVISLVDKPTNEFTMEDFHALRVDIKQIRTLFQYLNQRDPDFPYRKNFRPFKSLFQQAGRLRELQLLLATLTGTHRHPSLTGYIRELHQSIEKEWVRFLLLLTTPWQDDILKRRQKTEPCLKRLHTGIAKKKLAKKKKQIRRIIALGKLARQDVHVLRMDIKEVYYLEKALQVENPHSQKADTFQELLGEWHDQQVIGHQLQKAIRKYSKNKALSRSLHGIRKEIKSRENLIFEKILRDRNAFLIAFTPS